MISIAGWLSSLGLAEHLKRFAENAIDADVLVDLTDDDLKELGVPLGHRRKMMKAIAELSRGPYDAVARPENAIVRRDSAEQRQLTVLFCDLVGSTSLSTAS